MGEERTKKSAQNMITGFMYQFIVLILNFVSRTVFIQTLGWEYLGLNGIFSDVLSLLSMADLGFGTAMAYSFYKPLAEHDEGMLASLVAFYKKVYNIIAVAVLVLGLACIPFLRLIVNTEQDIPLLEVYYLFSLANVVISYLFVYKTTILTADQKNYQLDKIRIWTSLLKTIIQMVALLLFANYILYIAIGVLSQFINNVIATRMTEKQYPYIKNKALIGKVDNNLTKNVFGNMKSVFIYKVSTTIFSATDNILISVIVSTAIVGVYSNYLMVSNKLLLIEQIVFSALTASIGNVIVKESSKKRLEVFNAMQSASFIFCGIITSSFCILANDLVNVWLGNTHLLSDITIYAITLNTYLSCVLQPLWVYRDATGLYMKTKYVMLVGAAVNIILSVILGKLIGITGIIVASAIARLTTYFWYEPKLLFKEYFGAGVIRYYISILGNLLLVAVTIKVMQFVTASLPANNWGTLIIKGIITAASCSVIFLVAYCRTEGFKIIWRKAEKLLKKN